jgi:hypothetical protein
MQSLEIEELENLAAPDGYDVALGVGIGLLAGDLIWLAGTVVGEAIIGGAIIAT